MNIKKKSSVSLLSYIVLIGLFTKIISMSSRIVLSRELGVEVVSINSLVNPIFIFVMTIASFSLPTTISTLVAKHPDKGKSIFISSLVIATILNVVIIILLFSFQNFIAYDLLHCPETLLSIRLLCIVVPLTTISSIIKGYFQGKREIELTSSSSLIEECTRFLVVIFLVNSFKSYSIGVQATFFILVMIIGEIAQSSYLFLSSGKKYQKNIKKLKAVLDTSCYSFSEINSISFPTTLSRVITSASFMLEPIILMNVLLKKGYNVTSITTSYGILSSYVMPLLLFPGFFTLAISNYLLPNLAMYIEKKQFKKGSKILFSSLIFCLSLGIIISFTFLLFGEELLKIVYHSSLGAKELKILSLPFLIYYVETPINISMHALSLSKEAFKTSLLASVIRLLSTIILCSFIGVFGVAISTLIGCYIDVFMNSFFIIRFFKRNKVNTINK